MRTDIFQVSIKFLITLTAGVIGFLFVYKRRKSCGRGNRLSIEECNFLRLHILVMNIGTKAVRMFFRNKIPDAALQRHLLTNRIPVPQATGPNVQSKDLDLTRLYHLIRHTIPGLPKPSLGFWGARPLHHQILQSDDIERIRHCRNYLAHCTNIIISSTEFENRWLEISQAIDRLSNGYLNGEVLNLRRKTFLQSEKNFIEEEIQNIKDKVIELEQDLGNFQEQLMENEMRHIPLNVKECHLKILEKWKEEDKLFHVTRGCDCVYELITKHSVVAITGNSGSGKTAIAQHIALEFETKGFEVIPICNISEVLLYCKLERDQIFVLDNVIGTFAMDISKINNMEDHRERVSTILSERSKLIFTCRKTVYNEAQKFKSFALQKCIDLHEKNIDLDNGEKIQILTNHCKNENVPREIYSDITFPPGNMLIPLLCKLFSKNKRYQQLGKEFFQKPKGHLLDEMNSLQNKNSIQYAALVLCLLNDNTLSGQNFPSDEITYEIYENCRLDHGTARRKIIDALYQMEGTLLELSEDEHTFTFIHDFIFEMIAYHYGSQFPDHIIDFLSSGFIANKIVLCNDEKRCAIIDIVDTSITLNEVHFPKLANRLLKDLRSMELFNVFQNKALSNPAFRIKFEQVLMNLPYLEFKSLLFDEQNFKKCLATTIYHLNSTYLETRCDINDMDDMSYVLTEKELYGLLVDMRVIVENEEIVKTTFHCRVVSWIVCYGHTDLLRRIIKHVTENGDSVEIIFGKYQEENARLLVLSCFSGSIHMVELLINNISSDVINQTSLYTDIVDFFWDANEHRIHTSLTASCQAGHLDIVKFLVSRNADISKGNARFNLPLSVAVKFGHDKIVEYLLQIGAKPDTDNLFQAIFKGNEKVVSILIQYDSDVNITHFNKWTPLLMAAFTGHYGIVKLLIEHNANVNCCDTNNRTPLLIASKYGHFNIAKCIIEAGGNVNMHANFTERPSSFFGIFFVTNIAGYPTDIPQNYFTIPLFDALSNGHCDVVKLLLENGADVNMCGPDNESPLYKATNIGDYAIVSLLLQHGANLTIKNKLDLRPLQIALWKNRIGIARQLLKAENRIGNTTINHHYFKLLKDIVQSENFDEHHCMVSFLPEDLCSFIQEESFKFFSDMLKMGLKSHRVDNKGVTLVYRIISDDYVKDRLKKFQVIIRSNIHFKNIRDKNNVSLLEHARRVFLEKQTALARMKEKGYYELDCFIWRISQSGDIEKDCEWSGNIFSELRSVIRRNSL